MTKREERRKHKRFRVRDDVFVILKPSDTGVGRLRNISMGGLRCDYVTDRVSSIEATELDIFTTNSDFGLYKIPCQTVWHRITYESPLTSTSRWECGVEFGDLTQAQISQLEHFIQNYTEGEV
jgi:hypothetical protein